MKFKKILSMLLAVTVVSSSLTVSAESLQVNGTQVPAAASSEAQAEKTYVYGTMNIPYADFYEAEIATSNEVPVDAVTSATASKWKNFAGSYYAADEDGEGGTILGAKYNVAIESDVYEALKSANSPLLESFVESTEVPAAYKIMDKDGNFSAVNGTTKEAEGVTATLSTTSTWGDYQLTFEGLTVDTKSNVAGAIIETTDGTKYGLRHLENLWLKASELSWGSGFKLTEAKGNTLSYAHYESMMGKTISKITYICADGNVAVSDLNIYVPVKYNGIFTIADANQTAGAAAYTMDGFPTDGDWKLELPEGLKNASYENGKISYSAETLPGSYTVTATDASNKYAETSASFNVTTDKLPVEYKDGKVVGLENTTEVAGSNYIKNIATVNVKFGETSKTYKASGHGATAIIAEDGTVNMKAASKGTEVFAENGTYELTVAANGYPELTFTVERTDVSYVYGTMNIPYADFYEAEVGKTNEVAVDAVTSATASKWKNFAGSYYTANENGEGGTILGAKYNVAIRSDVYETLKSENSALLESFVESTEVPAAYKIMDKDGNFSVVKGASTEAEGVTATLSTTSTWGDYQLNFEGLTVDTKSNVAGAIIETTDGTRYGLRHLENLWLKASELSWGSGFKLTEAKGNTLSYAHYASMMGKTISKITYICADGNVTVSNLNIYVPVKYNGTITIPETNVTAGKVTVKTEGFPADGDWNAVVPETLSGASYKDGVLSYNKTALPGSYTITFKDVNNKYAETSASFILKTDVLPVQYQNNKITAAAGSTDAEVANFIKNISTVTVKSGETSKAYKASGHGAVAIIKEDGTINEAAASKGNAVFAAAGTYELTVEAAGYNSLTFAYTVAPAATETPVPTATPTPVPTATPTPVPTATETPVPTATPTPVPTATPKVKMNQKATVKGVTYQVTATKGTPTVKYVSTTSKSAKITIPSKVTINGVTCKVTAINAKAFKNNKKVTTVAIPSTVKTIGANAFQGCTKLSKITIPSSVTSIGSDAFNGCTKLTKVNIPAKVTSIGKNAFKGAKKLKTITISSKNIKKINTGAFKGINKKAVIKVTGSMTKKQKTALVKKIKKSGIAKTVTVK